MYNAPAVVFPVGRSSIEASFLLLFWVAGVAGIVDWLALSRYPNWVMAGATTLLFVTGFAALVQWRRRWVGALRWDRQKWTFSASPSDAGASQNLSGIAVLFDLQSVLLVRFNLSSGRQVSFWLDRSAARAQWPALRRALYARPRDRDKKSMTQNPGRKVQVA